MLTPKQVTDLFNKYNVGPSKRFGQNFLIDSNIISKIIQSSEIENKDVVEIGPGLGSLTHSLLPVAKSVTSYEIDEDMMRVLEGEITEPKFKLEKGDFLEANLNWEGKKVLVANIPYNITSDILFKLFENSSKFERAIIMIQKEVGDRLLAQPNDSEYSKLTVTANHFGKVSKVTLVKSSCFIPAPKVDSMVVRIDFNDNDYSKSDKFMKFVKICFAQRRKTIFNNLKNEYGRDKVIEILSKNNIKESSRPQELSYEQFIALFNEI